MKHIKTLLLEDDMFDLDFESNDNVNVHEEEQEETNTNSLNLTNKLLKNVVTSQELLNTYSNVEKMSDLIKIAETAIETSQMMVNFLNREYGPIQDIQQSIKKVLEQVYTDYQKYKNYDLAQISAHSIKESINIM